MPGKMNINNDAAQGEGASTVPPARGKAPAAMLSLALIGAVLLPIHENWRTKPHDIFPLSYFPMFSARRNATESFYYIARHNPTGPPSLIPHIFITPPAMSHPH